MNKLDDILNLVTIFNNKYKGTQVEYCENVTDKGNYMFDYYHFTCTINQHLFNFRLKVSKKLNKYIILDTYVDFNKSYKISEQVDSDFNLDTLYEWLNFVHSVQVDKYNFLNQFITGCECIFYDYKNSKDISFAKEFTIKQFNYSLSNVYTNFKNKTPLGLELIYIDSNIDDDEYLINLGNIEDVTDVYFNILDKNDNPISIYYPLSDLSFETLSKILYKIPNY